jgi:uncharacterized membrane protein YdjX (TVP38/TMEM64 family)
MSSTVLSDAPPNHRWKRIFLLAVWGAAMAGTTWIFVFHREAVQAELRSAMSVSVVLAGAIYLLLSSLRGFALIPAAPLLLTGIAFFPPVPLFLLTLTGIVISAGIIYWFAGSLHLEEIFSKQSAGLMARINRLLTKRELPVIIAWSLFPVTPTDLLVYVCGVLRVDFKKTLLGVAIGAGANSAVVIFLGDQILRFFGLKA